MPYLIDGHNLIPKIDGLRLDDPDDEVKLVMRLRGFMARKRRRCTVIFDRGLPGGRSRELSTSRVEVIFASDRSDADALIIKRIRQARDPAGLIVVSGDRQVVAAAGRQGARVMDPAQFVREMAGAAQPDGDDKPQPGPQDLDEWLDLFGGESGRT